MKMQRRKKRRMSFGKLQLKVGDDRVQRVRSLPRSAPVLGLVVLPDANHASMLARS
jgi:hypothetical protein